MNHSNNATPDETILVVSGRLWTATRLSTAKAEIPAAWALLGVDGEDHLVVAAEGVAMPAGWTLEPANVTLESLDRIIRAWPTGAWLLAHTEDGDQAPLVSLARRRLAPAARDLAFEQTLETLDRGVALMAPGPDKLRARAMVRRLLESHSEQVSEQGLDEVWQLMEQGDEFGF